ncbi:MAG: hypothetical protein A2519_02060 [Candidatus Raymondbacteria bacterium RIFOXYD12_FULL_49_13]|uniref:DUF2764 domain-containing protein n=1 Tax=Candidatus Raymondbacteria bacterium RIFOXYD12_FULL_49_13 TaxID=1817890 RepID=A0A1F7FAT8_UNCRA|nr:MAG: hypothetical protein A2519_02060 [Candidatus Raymondbacteria bacterium RIFOXYD12_FULL_49_13]
MSQSYYYLVAGLPDLALDEKRQVPAIAEFLSQTEEELDPGDRALVSLLRCPFDNANLITLLENRRRPFDQRGHFTRDELETEIKNPSALPEYMIDFLSAHKEGRQLFPGLASEDQLAWLFYDTVSDHANQFIREWFLFDLNLRNALTALNCRENAAAAGLPASELIEKAVICRNEVAELLRRSNAPDFSLGTIFREIEEILSFPRERLADFEKSIDLLRWRVLDELVFLRAFAIDAILAFIIKLDIAHRWLRLDPAEGRRMLDGLVSGVKSGLVIS